jgi:hypothetical protein
MPIVKLELLTPLVVPRVRISHAIEGIIKGDYWGKVTREALSPREEPYDVKPKSLNVKGCAYEITVFSEETARFDFSVLNPAENSLTAAIKTPKVTMDIGGQREYIYLSNKKGGVHDLTRVFSVVYVDRGMPEFDLSRIVSS